MQANFQKIVVLGTGGTIAGESRSANEGLAYTAGQRGVAQLLEAVAGKTHSLPESLAGCQIETEQVAQLDSKDMDFATWIDLAKRCEQHLTQADVGALVITHGTDTLEETAYFLSRVMTSEKPIVLTCAMRPANFKDADGPQNLRDALNVAAQLKGRGVWMVAAGEIHHSQFVQKVHPTRLNAFDSGEHGAAGKVISDQIRWSPSWTSPLPEPLLDVAKLPSAENWPWVEIILNHVQAGNRGLNCWVAAGLQGVVVAGTGNGAMSETLKQALQKAQSHGVLVRVASRCSQGPVIATENHAFETSGNLNAVKTRVALMLDILSKQQSH